MPGGPSAAKVGGQPPHYSHSLRVYANFDSEGPRLGLTWSVFRSTRRDGEGYRLRSPLSPCPFLATVFAFCFWSCDRDRPTSSDSLNCPLSSRRTKRLSEPVSINSRLDCFFLLGMMVCLRERTGSTIRTFL